jgi:hypothetical protein
MSMDKPFRVEVVVDAPRDAVWRALTEPEQIRHWFGWDYDGLQDEIELIFVQHATLVPPNRIEMSEDGLIELEEAGPGRTLIRATKPGDLDAAEWRDVYGDIVFAKPDGGEAMLLVTNLRPRRRRLHRVRAALERLVRTIAAIESPLPWGA